MFKPFAAAVLSLLVACVAGAAQPAPSREAVLTGAITGLKEAVRLRVSQPFQESSDIIEVPADGKFTYTRALDQTIVVQVSQTGTRGAEPVIPGGLEVVLSPGSRLTLRGNVADPASFEVTGDRLNDIYRRYMLEKRPYDQKYAEARKALREAKEKGESAGKLAELEARRDRMQDQAHRFDVEFTRKNPENYALLNEMAGNFLAYEDRGAEMEEAFMALSPELRNSPIAKYIPAQAKALKATTPGAVAPDFTRPDMHGKTVSLKDFRGKYVVLDFWGSWCGPCRASHPGLIEVYKKYKDKGLEIISIALENDDLATAKTKWLEAIEKDGISLWTQVLNNQDVEKMNIVESYGIIAYPTKILLDRQGKVIAKYLGPDDVKPKLHELFAN